MTLGLIWAQDRRGVIGSGGGIPWRLAEDQARFRRLTMGGTVIMGRATWDSLPARYRPLDGRRNIVLTHRGTLGFDGAETAASLPAALALADGDTAWCIGGGRLYEQFLPRATHLEITDVDMEVEGADLVFAPDPGPDFVEAGREPAAGWHESANGVRYRYRTLIRR